jgi:Spy/CpxP family protein refolding chaperone
MKRSNLTIAVSMLAVFLSGIAVGGVAYRSYTVKTVTANAPPPPKSPEDFRKRYISELDARLKLKPDQAQKLNAILDETRTRYRAEKERSKAEMKRIHDGQVEEVRSILTDAQRAEYQKFHDEREAQMKEIERNKKASGL